MNLEICVTLDIFAMQQSTDLYLVSFREEMMGHFISLYANI